jgi:beta-lactamase superfamily II metal-dependent hydrolase
MNFYIKIFSVGCADAILITFIGSDNQKHHILLDSGNENNSTLLEEEFDKMLSLDLLVITHIDNDHIGGLYKYIEEGGVFKQDFIKNCWFNALSKVKNKANAMRLIGIKQGILVRDVLTKKLGIELPFITDLTQPLDLFGAKLTIVSPDTKCLDKMMNKWRTAEPIGAKQSDYHKTIEHFFAQKPPSFQTSTENESSIAFLFEYHDFKMLFLADSHPSVVERSLRGLGYSETNKLTIAYLKVSHHGSRLNTSEALLSLLDCRKFVFTADGKSNPDKETLARIIKHYYNPNVEPLSLIFNHQNTKLESIFDVDENPFIRYNFTVKYPKIGQNAYIIEH